MAKRVTIVINSLVQGGAQKSAVLLAKELLKNGFSVQLLVFYPEETDFFVVPNGVQIERLIHPFQENNRIRVRFRILRISLRLLYRVKDFFEMRGIVKSFKPDLVISFEAATSVISFFALFGISPLLVSERVHPAFHSIPRWAEVLRPIVYKAKNVSIHCQGLAIASWISKNYGKYPVVIPNFLGTKMNAVWKEDSKKVKIFSRYTEQKGIDIAINAWNLLPQNIRTGFKLEVFGDGDRTEYQLLVENLELMNFITLNGPTKDVGNELSDCLIFLLPSRFEGFPNALSEAIVAGIPSIATDCPSAIRDLTREGEYAILSEVSPAAVANALLNLISNKDRMYELHIKGPEIEEIFGQEKILGAWIDLVDQVVTRNSSLNQS
jgi:glycosyltransferase involved in cell wall biosynthesis